MRWMHRSHVEPEPPSGPRFFCAAFLATLGLAVLAGPTWAQSPMVLVGDAGNAPNANSPGGSTGSVGYNYYIAAFETTIGEYTEFLNAAAASDPYGLYNLNMGTDANIFGIARNGVSGSYSYTATNPDRPVTYVSYYDAARYVNWLNNGKGTGNTETGAYTLSEAGIFAVSRAGNIAGIETTAPSTIAEGDQVTISGVAEAGFNGTFIVTKVLQFENKTVFTYDSTGQNVGLTLTTGSVSGVSATHAEDATFWIPTRDEWYKAAYYDPGAGGPAGDYWLYPTQSNDTPGNDGPGANTVNYKTDVYAVTQEPDLSSGELYLTPIGFYGEDSASHYGTYDQGGNVREWNEYMGNGARRGTLGGDWFSSVTPLGSDLTTTVALPTSETDRIGFRVASSVPEPSVAALLLLGGGWMASKRRRRIC